MFEQFSSAYYLGRLYLEPYTGQRAVIHTDQYEQVTDQLYEAEGYSGPLVMKIGSTHLAVHGAGGVPGRTVALPKGTLSETGVEAPPTLAEVLLAKADRARQLLGLGGDVPAVAAEGNGRSAGF